MSNSDYNSFFIKQSLDKNYNALLSDRAQIIQLEKEYVTINAADKDAQLILTEYYSKYIAFTFVTILLVLLLLKYAITGGEQIGGAGTSKHFFIEDIFLIVLIISFFGLAHIFNYVNMYVLYSIIAILFILFKLKIVNKYLD